MPLAVPLLSREWSKPSMQKVDVLAADRPPVEPTEMLERIETDEEAEERTDDREAEDMYDAPDCLLTMLNSLFVSSPSLSFQTVPSGLMCPPLSSATRVGSVEATCFKRALGSAQSTDSSVTSAAWRSDRFGRAEIMLAAADRMAGAIWSTAKEWSRTLYIVSAQEDGKKKKDHWTKKRNLRQNK